MGVTINASAKLTVDADTRPGGTVPVPYGENSTFDRGFAMNGMLAASDAAWTGRVVLAALGQVVVSPAANTYSTSAGSAVYGPMAYTRDLAGRAMNHSCWGLQVYNSTAGAAGASTYVAAWGQYSGTAGQWNGTSALGRIYRGDGVLQAGYGIEGTTWIFYNTSATDPIELEVVCAGKYNG